MPIFKRRPKPVQLRSLDELRPMLASGDPVLIDFYQFGCAPCQVMDGIVNELAEDYEGTVHVVKVNVAQVHGAAQMFKIRSTPTFVLLGTAPKKRRSQGQGPDHSSARITPRWRGTGLIKKDFLARVLENNGAIKAGAQAPD